MSCYVAKEHCRLCASRALAEVVNLGQSPIGEDFILPAHIDKVQALYPVTVMRCTACGHLQLGHVVSKKDLYFEYLYDTSRSLGLDRHFADYAEKLALLEDIDQGALAVDIGSNTGVLVRAMQTHGFIAVGVEPAPHIAEQANANGIPTYCGYFDAPTASMLLQQHGMAAIITTNNCFANIDDLDAFMVGVDTLLSPAGYFVIETGYGLDLIKNFVVDNIYHEHLSYFLLNPLRQFLLKHGFDVVKVERVPTKGGSIRVYARRQQKVSSLPWDVQGLITLERELGFGSDTPFVQFRHVVTEKVRAIHDTAQQWATQGAVAAFGAAVGCTALMYWAKIEKYISFIVDDNAVMHGRLSPAQHIPVLPPKALYTRKPPVLLVLPWRYSYAILQRHEQYLEQGGTVVQILPEIVISQQVQNSQL